MEAVTLYKFEAREEDELSIQKGTVLYVTDVDRDEHWFDAEYNGKGGLIPKNYVHMRPHKWYKGPMTRAKAEDVLIDQPVNGAFLIRKSESSPKNYSLSVKVSSEVQHFRILKDEKSKYFL